MTKGEATGFLYPFLDAEERDATALLADLTASAEGKIADSRALSNTTLNECAARLDKAAADMATSFDSGGRLFCFGNGGSATDATGTARLFSLPPAGRALPAHSLADDPATLTALANDVGFEVVFARQLAAHGRRGDIALGFSTSGNSPNLLVAMRAGRELGMVTVAVCGTGGGKMAESGDVDHCLVVASDSVHRIQEAHRALVVALWSRVLHQLRECR